MALYTVLPGGASPADFATAEAAALVVPNAEDRDGPTSPEDTGSSASVVVLYCVKPGGRASSPDFATAVAVALVVPCADLQRNTLRDRVL